jgi:hypothetical protein
MISAIASFIEILVTTLCATTNTFSGNAPKENDI